MRLTLVRSGRILPVLLVVVGAGRMIAQTTSASEADLEGVAQLAAQGRAAEARARLSDWFASHPDVSSGPRTARARFLRARLAESADSAAADYQWLVVEGGDEYAPVARLLLAQLDVTRRNLSAAETRLGRLRSDYPDHELVSVSWLWTGHVAEARGDAAAACEAWRRARSTASSSTRSSARPGDQTGSGPGDGSPGRSMIGGLDSQLALLLRSCDEPAVGYAADGQPAVGYAAQLGAFREREPAERLLAAAAVLGIEVTVVAPRGNDDWYRVRSRVYSERQDAERAAARANVRRLDAIVVRVGG